MTTDNPGEFQIFGQCAEFVNILVKEVVQAKDVFLLHFNCPKCKEGLFQSFPIVKCNWCKKDLSPNYITFDKSEKKILRCLAGTERKSKSAITKRIVRKLLIIQENNCAYCDKPLEDYHLEHIRPIAVGGTNNIENLCIACPRCNLLCGDKVFRTFFEKKSYVYSKLLAKRGKYY